jgi:hypothetical protein
MDIQRYSSSGRSELSEREQNLLAAGYRPVESDDLRPGEYRTSMVTDRGDKVGAVVFILEWVELNPEIL